MRFWSARQCRPAWSPSAASQQNLELAGNIRLIQKVEPSPLRGTKAFLIFTVRAGIVAATLISEAKRLLMLLKALSKHSSINELLQPGDTVKRLEASFHAFHSPLQALSIQVAALAGRQFGRPVPFCAGLCPRECNHPVFADEPSYRTWDMCVQPHLLQLFVIPRHGPQVNIRHLFYIDSCSTHYQSHSSSRSCLSPHCCVWFLLVLCRP